MKLISYIVLPIVASNLLAGQMKAVNTGEENTASEPGMHQLNEVGVLRLDSTYLNLGTLPPDTIAIGTIGFVNAGDAPLSIITIFAECGCTVPSYSHDPILPGGRGEITVKFSSKGRRAGDFRKALRIRSDASNARVTFHIKGKVATKCP